MAQPSTGGRAKCNGRFLLGIGPAPLLAIGEIRSGMLKPRTLLLRVANLPNRVCVPSHCPHLSIGIK